MKIYRYKKLPSTQEKAKRLKVKEDTAVFADFQTKGKGTKGRSFSSETGGVYLSLIKLYPEKAKDAFKIMVSSAVAVVKTLEAFGIKAGIKWPNDIFVSGKKICGILIENELSGEDIKKSIIGIGINVNSKIPEELKDIAVSAKEILGEPLSVESVGATLLYNLTFDYSIEEYKKHSLVLDRAVTVVAGDEKFVATAKDITNTGELVLESGEKLSSAEISIIL